MQTLIEGYRNYPGEHCGSVAMRGLLGFYCGLELPEDVLFGLGAGVDSAYICVPGTNPSAFSAGPSSISLLPCWVYRPFSCAANSRSKNHHSRISGRQTHRLQPRRRRQ